MRTLDWIIVGSLLAGAFAAGQDVPIYNVCFGVIAAAMVLRGIGAFMDWVDGK